MGTKIPKGKIIQYEHHEVQVFVDENLKGLHRDICLCMRPCAKFCPEPREKNCPRANLLYAYDVAFGMVTPVVECPEFEPAKTNIESSVQAIQNLKRLLHKSKYTETFRRKNDGGIRVEKCDGI